MRTFEWKRWEPRPLDLVGRALWLLLALGGVLAAAPVLDWAAARGAGARARTTAGRKLRWLDRLLAPFARGAFGVLAVAELKLALRERRLWWWLAALVLLGVQLFGSAKGLQVSLLLAWLLPIDLLARSVLRERDNGTGALVFTAPRMLARLLAVRFVVGLALMLMLSLPGLLRLGAMQPLSALAALAAIASVVSWGLALGALLRNARLFELLLVGSIYVGMQGAPLFDVGAGAASTLMWHGAALLPAWLALAWAWPRMARPA